MCINLNIKNRILLKGLPLISYKALRRNPLHQQVKPTKQENDTIKSTEQVPPKKLGYQAPVSGSPTTLDF
jgi:hypothetical protein